MIETFDRLLPSHLCWKLTKQALEECGKYGIKLAFRALSKGDLKTTYNQIREVLRSTRSLKILSVIVLVPWLAVLAFLWRALRKIFVAIA